MAPGRDGIDIGSDSAAGLSASELDLLLFHNVLEASFDILYFKDRDSRYLRLSRGAADALRGTDPDAQVGTWDFDHYEREHAQTAFDQEQAIVRTGQPLVDVIEHQKWPDRPDTWLSTTKLPLLDADGVIVGTFGISRDITQRILSERAADQAAALYQRTHQALQRAEADLRAIIESSPDGIVRFDKDLRHTYLNPAAMAVLGGQPDRLIGLTTRECGQLESMLSVWEPALRHVLETGEPGEVAYELIVGPARYWFHSRLVAELDDQQAVVGVLTTSRNLTQLKVAEQVLEHQASHDPLTGLANRTLLFDRLEQAILRLRRRPGVLVVLFVDLNGFKDVNDRYGHEVGDLVLIETSRRLSEIARVSDTVARIGGDEYVLVCEQLPGQDLAGHLVRRVQQALAVPFAAAPSARVSGSVGVATSTDAATTPEHLLRRADHAMYEAKRAYRHAHDQPERATPAGRSMR